MLPASLSCWRGEHPQAIATGGIWIGDDSMIKGFVGVDARPWRMLTVLVSFTSTDRALFYNPCRFFQGGTNSLAYRHDVGQR